MRVQVVLTLTLSLFVFVGVLGAEETVPRRDLVNRVEALFKEAQGHQSRANRLRVVGRALTPEEQAQIERTLHRVKILHRLIDVLKEELDRAGDRVEVTLSAKSMGAIRELRAAFEKVGRKRNMKDLPGLDRPRKEGGPRSEERKERRPTALPQPPEMELMRGRIEILQMQSRRHQVESKLKALESARHQLESKARKLDIEHLQFEMQAREIDRRLEAMRKRLERAEARLKGQGQPQKNRQKERGPGKGKQRKKPKDKKSGRSV